MAATVKFGIIHHNFSLVKNFMFYFFRQIENWQKILWIVTLGLEAKLI